MMPDLTLVGRETDVISNLVALDDINDALTADGTLITTRQQPLTTLKAGRDMTASAQKNLKLDSLSKIVFEDMKT